MLHTDWIAKDPDMSLGNFGSSFVADKHFGDSLMRRPFGTALYDKKGTVLGRAVV